MYYVYVCMAILLSNNVQQIAHSNAEGGITCGSDNTIYGV